jgi:hypothetical protein
VSAQPDTYPTPEHGWTCFHCGDHFPGTMGGEKSARAHFGNTPDARPACIIKGDFGLLRALRYAEREAARWRSDVHNETSSSRNYYAHLQSELRGFKPFRGCRSVQDAFNIYDSMEGRALAAEERVAELERLINTRIFGAAAESHHGSCGPGEGIERQ